MTQRPSEFADAFANTCVLVTGHTGFKGAWLCLWLSRLGAKVHGFSIDVPTSPSLYEDAAITRLLEGDVRGDIRDLQAIASAVDDADPDVIFHLAAQPLVRHGYKDPKATFETNVLGTVNLLEAVRQRQKPCVVVIVTSDKCYDNREQVWGYKETDPMGGHDPYSASKGCAELVVASYRASFFPASRLGEHGVKLASARAGNVIGGGDWAADRLSVDLIKGFASQTPVTIRNPGAVRPWQHVLEPLSGYLLLAARMLKSDDTGLLDGWNFGPGITGEISVGEIADLYSEAWGEGAGWCAPNLGEQPHEAGTLRLSVDKAATILGWHPVWSLSQTVSKTVDWYRFYCDDKSLALDLCTRDLEAFSEACER